MLEICFTQIFGIKKKVKEEKNFCLFLSWGPPHCPYKDVPQKYLDMYPSKDIKLRPNVPKHADKSIIAGYYAHITALDECFGQVMKTIDECNIGENTIVVFASDHGDMLFSQNRGWKGKPWRESINIPFIIRWDKHIPKNINSDELISLVDVMPTLLSLANIQIPEQVEGVDVSKTMIENQKNIQEEIFINYPVCPERFSFNAWRGVVTKKFTYARTKEAPWLLYDNKSDYYQVNNLVNQEDKKNILDEMEKILAKIMRKMDDKFESSEELCKKYYLGSIKGTFPYYENDIIKRGKEEII